MINKRRITLPVVYSRPSITRNSQRRNPTPSKSLKKTAFEVKGRLYTTGKVIQRLFIIDLYTYLAIYRYR